MINTATSYLALLQMNDIQLKSIALDKINMLIDEHWTEISDYITLLKSYYDINLIPQKQNLIALILSKLYYNLEEYNCSIDWALKCGSLFDINQNSLYVKTILRKLIDKYISFRKENFFNNENQKELDQRILNIIDAMFNSCLKANQTSQAIGFCIESYDLDRLTKVIENSSNPTESLNFVYELSQIFVDNKEYNEILLSQILKLYLKYAKENYMQITNCQFLLNNLEALANTLMNIISEGTDVTIAYQICFDLYENQNPAYLKTLKNKLTGKQSEKPVDKKQYETLISILSGNEQRRIIKKVLSKYNHSEKKTMEKLIESSEKQGNIVQLGVILAHSFLNSHTGDESFMKDNMPFISKATNWARFTTAASLGVVHMGNTEKGLEKMKDFCTGGAQASSIYTAGGGYYGVGLIYAGTGDEGAIKFLNDALNKPSNNKEPCQHGIYLGLGLVAMGSGDAGLYERIRDGIYTDDAIIGEAASYAIGLLMAGTKDEQAIEDLLRYVHDTQHEKIIRAIALALSLIVYGVAEKADTLIEQLIREKDPILRYGAMYCIGMAYAGTSNSKMLEKLIKFSVSDVSDDVRRAALINIGFLEFKNPDVLFNNIKVLNLLSESYNSHARYGAAMAIGISCAGSGKIKAYKVLEPLFFDTNYLVRQAALLATGFIFSQTTGKQEAKMSEFKENLNKIIESKDEHALIKFGALISKGIYELGGQNCILSLTANSGENKMISIIGMCLFTQYYYWFPMIHMLNLAVTPSFVFNLDENLVAPTNFYVKSNAKPGIFGYKIEEEEEKKKTEVKTEVAILSTHTRVNAKARKTGTLTMEMKSQTFFNKPSVDLKQAPSGVLPTSEPKDEEKKEKKEEEIKITVEPQEETLNNPIRILPLQRKLITVPKNQTFEQMITGRLNGFVLLKKTKEDSEAEYDEEDKKLIEERRKKEEEEKNKINENAVSNSVAGENSKGNEGGNQSTGNNPIGNQAGGQGYQPLAEDDDIPEDFDLDEKK